jgi:hypothetical protein
MSMQATAAAQQDAAQLRLQELIQELGEFQADFPCA